MKRILITGANSYVGTSLEKWLSKWPEEYRVDTISVRGEEWKSHDFSKYDVVFHVAGIAHVSTDPKMEDLYYKVNRDLTIEVAKKSKLDKVKQFIFMSSIIVYGDSAPIGKKKIITKDTIPEPSNFYGRSKLEAEEGIMPLQSDNFNIVVLRPPMIFGKGSKGNYPKLAKMAQKLPIFPDVKNERSMLYIDNLCQFVKLMIDNEESGVFFPQNREYTNTSEMVGMIVDVKGNKIIMIPGMNLPVRLLGKVPGKIGVLTTKAFGDFAYDMSMSNYKENYRVRTLAQSIYLMENTNDNLEGV